MGCIEERYRRKEIREIKTLYASTLQHKLFCYKMLVERDTSAEGLEWEIWGVQKMYTHFE